MMLAIKTTHLDLKFYKRLYRKPVVESLTKTGDEEQLNLIRRKVEKCECGDTNDSGGEIENKLSKILQ